MYAVEMARYGDAECLVGVDRPTPEEGRGWSLVRLHAAALNWHDVLVRQGKYSSPLPHVLGADGAGIDLATGDEVVIVPSLWWGADESAPGPDWQILGDTQPGTYAEVVRVPSECVVPKPAGFSWAEAAALPLVGLTTFRALFSRADLRAGESLLVLGAGGGVATMAVALGTAVGSTVVVTSSTEDKITRAQECGAIGGVLYGDPNWPQAVKALSPGARGFDVVLDSVGTWQQSIDALRPGGRIVVLGASRADQAPLAVRPFYFGQFSLLGTTMGSPRDFAGLVDLLDTHDVSPPLIDRTFALDSAADAHRYLESGQAFGKVVLEIA
jgi:NADPH:quinone reductase-like Zn-dependent oxidoreductase